MTATAFASAGYVCPKRVDNVVVVVDVVEIAGTVDELETLSGQVDDGDTPLSGAIVDDGVALSGTVVDETSSAGTITETPTEIVGTIGCDS